MPSSDLYTGSGSNRLHYLAEGPPDAPPILLLHSLGVTLDLWAVQVEQWSQRFRILRYDMRGHGQSAVPPGEYSVQDLGEDAIRILDAEGIGRALVCGISIGGLTTMWLGVNRPDRVSGAIVANTSARVGTRERWVERIATIQAEGLTPIAAMATTNWFTPAFRERRPDVVAQFHHAIMSTDLQGYVSCCAALRDADLRDDLARFGPRALVIAGAEDVTATVNDAELIASRIPGATLVTLPGAHLTNVESAAEFCGEAESFFTAILAS
jgi:3-oxoadipate enol-lactonase